MDNERLRQAVAMFLEMVEGKEITELYVEMMPGPYNENSTMRRVTGSMNGKFYKYAIYFDDGNYMEADGF